MLVAAYCKKGLLCKAESIVRDAVQSGRTTFANTWECLAGSYFKANQIPKAVEFMKKALVAHGNSLRNPKPENISAGLEYFKVQQDVKAAEEFVNLLRRVSPLTREVYHRLLSIYVIIGKSFSDVLHRMKEDGFDADEGLATYLSDYQAQLPLALLYTNTNIVFFMQNLEIKIWHCCSLCDCASEMMRL